MQIKCRVSCPDGTAKVKYPSMSEDVHIPLSEVRTTVAANTGSPFGVMTRPEMVSCAGHIYGAQDNTADTMMRADVFMVFIFLSVLLKN